MNLFSFGAKARFIVASTIALGIINAVTPAWAQEDNPILLELRPQLQAEIQKIVPDAIWELKGNELTASYKVQPYTVHSISPNGSIEAQPHQEIGPQNGGFLLRVRVFSRLPAFAAPKSSGIRQAYWRGTLVRYNLRSESDSAPLFPDPKITQTERMSETNDRVEFLDVPLSSSVYVRLQRMDSAGLNTGLFRVLSGGKMAHRPITRYEASVLMMRLLDQIPDLSGNRMSRLKALQGATQKDFSAAELGVLDHDIRELQAEFANEIARLGAKVSTGIEVRGVAPGPIMPFKPQYLVFSLSQGLTQNVLSTEALLKTVNDWVEEKNEVADNK